MNRNLLIAGIVVIILVALAGGYLFMNRAAMNLSLSTQSPMPVPTSLAEKTSLKDFMLLAGNQKCEFNDPETGNSGTVYSGSGKMRGDFSAQINGKVTPSHMINDGGSIYIWMDEGKTGYKTTLEAIENVNGLVGGSQTIDINKKVDYSCSSWTVDEGQFIVPTDKQFTDMTKMMQDAAKMMQNATPAASVMQSNPNVCAACDNLTGDNKIQCKVSLKCN